MNIKGVGIGRGVAVGPVIRMAAPLPEPSDAPRAENISAETEIARVEKSLALVNADLNRRAEEAANGDEGAKQAAPILQAIAMFASDPSLAQSIKDLINQGKTAERAVLEGFGAVEDMFRAIGGYQAERAADLHDVGQRVIADLMGAPAPGLPVSETPFVLVAEDLSPADTAALDMSKTLAIVTSQGGPTSHTAILARARGIVAVVSAAEAAELENGTNVIVNAAKGEIVVNPSEDEIAAAEAAKSRAAAAKELRGKPGATKDGHLIPLLANVGKPSDAAKALEYGAEGVGLFRTEFLFIGNSEPRYLYTISLNADWNGFFLSALFDGVGRQQWFPSDESLFWGMYNRPYNQVPTWHLQNYWTEERPNAYLPRYVGYYGPMNANTVNVNTRYLQDVSYIRLKNLQFGYELPKRWISKIGLSKVSVYFSGENLWSWSPLYRHTKDFDVTVASKKSDSDISNSKGDGHNYPVMRSFSFGISITY